MTLIVAFFFAFCLDVTVIFAEPLLLRALTTPFELTLTIEALLDLYVTFLLAF